MVGNKNTKNKQNSFNHLQMAFLLHVCPKDNNTKKLAVTATASLLSTQFHTLSKKTSAKTHDISNFFARKIKSSQPSFFSLTHLCPGLHANAKIAIFAKNRKNRKLCKEEDKSPTRTRDFGENCDFCDFSQKSLKSPPFSGTCVLYHFSVVPCLRF